MTVIAACVLGNLKRNKKEERTRRSLSGDSFVRGKPSAPKLHRIVFVVFAKRSEKLPMFLQTATQAFEESTSGAEDAAHFLFIR